MSTENEDSANAKVVNMERELAEKLAGPNMVHTEASASVTTLCNTIERLQAQLASAVAAETEACAHFLETHHCIHCSTAPHHRIVPSEAGPDAVMKTLAAAIRARISSDTLKRLEAEREVIEAAREVKRSWCTNYGIRAAMGFLCQKFEQLEALDAPQPAQEATSGKDS